MERRAGQPIAIFGISQGGLLPRWALTYWPSLRAKVTDVLAAAGTQHGTALGDPAACAAGGCAPGRVAAGRRLQAARRRQRPARRDPGPDRLDNGALQRRRGGPAADRTAPDLRAAGRHEHPHPVGVPGRMVSHIGTALDSVTFAAFADALAHKGAARIARLPKGVCAHPYAPGLDEARHERGARRQRQPHHSAAGRPGAARHGRAAGAGLRAPRGRLTPGPSGCAARRPTAAARAPGGRRSPCAPPRPRARSSRRTPRRARRSGRGGRSRRSDRRAGGPAARRRVQSSTSCSTAAGSRARSLIAAKNQRLGAKAPARASTRR